MTSVTTRSSPLTPMTCWGKTEMDEARAKELVSERRRMALVQRLCDRKDYPYPEELISYLKELQRRDVH